MNDQNSSMDVPKIIVMQSEFETGGSDLVYAIVRYVNNMLEKDYNARSLAQHAMQVYHSDLYFAQVNNGGHGQFYLNVRKTNDYEDVKINIAAGLRAMGADNYLSIFERFLKWEKDNPDWINREVKVENTPESMAKVGEALDVLSKDLGELDAAFFNEKNMADISAGWIKTWPNLHVVEQSQYQTEMSKLFALNHDREIQKPEGTEAHYVLPHVVYEKYRDLIEDITKGEFNQDAMYNIVFLYTDPENAKRAGTVLYGTELDAYISLCTDMMEDISKESDPEKQLSMFKGFHAYLREGMWTNKPEGLNDPCASKNPLPATDLNKTTSAPLSQKSDWQPPTNEPEGYGVRAERAPIGRWLLSALLLLSIIAGAIWLASKVVVPDNVPKGKIDLPTAEKTEENKAEPVKKSSDEEAWIRALEKDTLEGYREYLTLFPDGKFKEDAQKEINAYDNKAWATAEQRQTLAGYEDYLEAWPEGLHASKAREK